MISMKGTARVGETIVGVAELSSCPAPQFGQNRLAEGTSAEQDSQAFIVAPEAERVRGTPDPVNRIPAPSLQRE